MMNEIHDYLNDPCDDTAEAAVEAARQYLMQQDADDLDRLQSVVERLLSGDAPKTVSDCILIGNLLVAGNLALTLPVMA